MKSTAQYFLLVLALLCVMGTHAFAASECSLFLREDNSPDCYRDCSHACQLVETYVPGGEIIYSCSPCEDALVSNAMVSVILLPAGENIAIFRKISK